MESVEGTGRTVDEAIENALDELGLDEDDVTVMVLAEAGPDQEARVLVTAREDLEELDDIEAEVGEVDEQPRTSGGWRVESGEQETRPVAPRPSPLAPPEG